MKRRSLVRLCCTVCAAALCAGMLPMAVLAADDNVEDLGTIRSGEEYEITSERGGTVSVRIAGNPPINERRAMTSASPAQPYASVVYDFDDIPEGWVIPIRRNDKVVGYHIVVPGDKRSSFRISGTRFATVQKMEEITYGDPIALTEGKAKTMYHVHAIKVMLRD